MKCIQTLSRDNPVQTTDYIAAKLVAAKYAVYTKRSDWKAKGREILRTLTTAERMALED